MSQSHFPQQARLQVPRMPPPCVPISTIIKGGTRNGKSDARNLALVAIHLGHRIVHDRGSISDGRIHRVHGCNLESLADLAATPRGLLHIGISICGAPRPAPACWSPNSRVPRLCMGTLRASARGDTIAHHPPGDPRLPSPPHIHVSARKQPMIASGTTHETKWGRGSGQLDGNFNVPRGEAKFVPALE